MGLKLNLINSAWMVIGRILKMGLTFLVGIAVARYMGPTGFGEYSFAISLVFMFTVLANLGLNHMMIREFSDSPEKSGQYIGTCLVLKIGGGLVAYLGLILAVFILDLDLQSRLLVLVYGLSLIFQSINIVGVFFESRRESKYLILSEMVQTFLFALAKIHCILHYKSVVWFVGIQSTEWLLVSVPLFLFQQRRDKTFFRSLVFNLDVARGLLRESWPFIFAGAAALIYQRIDQVMLRQMVSSEEVGYYAAASRLTIFLGVVPLLLVRSLTPALVEAKQRSEKLFAERYQLLNDLITLGILAASAGLAFGSAFIIHFLFGESYAKSGNILSILAWKSIFTAMGVASGQYILLAGLQKYVPLRQGIGCGVNILLNMWLIPRYGAVGAAWASVAATSTALFVVHIFIPDLRGLFMIQLNSFRCGLWNLMRFLREKVV